MAKEIRLFGVPGSGKTTRLTALINEKAKEYNSDEIIVASFTKTAAEELRGKDLWIDDNMVGTLHSLCLKSVMLQHKEQCEKQGLPAPTRLILAESGEALKEWNAKYSNGHPYYIDITAKNSFDASPGTSLLNALKYYRARMVPFEQWHPSVLMFYKEWQTWKATREVPYLDYTDMIELVLVQKLPPPGNPKIGFFDEVQDFSKMQLEVIRMWGENLEEYYLAGDDDQTIFEFQGADVETFIKEESISKNEYLRQSYRCARKIVEFSKRLTNEIMHRVEKEFDSTDEEGEIRVSQAAFTYPDPLAVEIPPLLLDNKTIMVLASCRYMLTKTVELFKEEGIPFWNPYHRDFPEWNSLQSSTGTPVSRRLYSYMKGMMNWTFEDVKLFSEHISADYMVRGAKAKIKVYQVNKQHSVLGKMYEWFLPETMDRLICDTDPVYYQSLLVNSSKEAYNYAVKVCQKYGQAALIAAPLITIGTIHSVKGGQADIVFVYPNVSAAFAKECHVVGKDYIKRLFYVACTRAKTILYKCRPGRGTRGINW